MINPSCSGFLIEVNGIRGFQSDKNVGLVWYTDGSKTEKGTGAGVYCHGTRKKLSFDLGRYTTVFQAEVYAIKACAAENIDKDYKNKNIYILSDHLKTGLRLSQIPRTTGIQQRLTDTGARSGGYCWK
jgi:hypothetical protein